MQVFYCECTVRSVPCQLVSAITSGTVLVIYAANVSQLWHRSFAELPLRSECNLPLLPESTCLGYTHAHEVLYTAR